MVGFYDRAKATANRLLTKFNRGELQLRRIAVTPPPNDWTPPVETTTNYPLKGFAKRLHQRYENGALVIETGDMVTFVTPDVTPLKTDLMIIDGNPRVITNLTPVLGAGDPLLWKAWCAL